MVIRRFDQEDYCDDQKGITFFLLVIIYKHMAIFTKECGDKIAAIGDLYIDAPVMLIMWVTASLIAIMFGVVNVAGNEKAWNASHPDIAFSTTTHYLLDTVLIHALLLFVAVVIAGWIITALCKSYAIDTGRRPEFEQRISRKDPDWWHKVGKDIPKTYIWCVFAFFMINMIFSIASVHWLTEGNTQLEQKWHEKYPGAPYESTVLDFAAEMTMLAIALFELTAGALLIAAVYAWSKGHPKKDVIAPQTCIAE